MSDYDDDFEEEGLSKPSALMRAATSVGEEEEADAYAAHHGQLKENKVPHGSEIPSAAVKPRKKKKKFQDRKSSRPKPSRSTEPEFNSRLWNERRPGYNNGRSRFARSSDLMRSAGFEDRAATGGTKAGSALMHASLAGDKHLGDVQRILKPPRKKEGKKRRSTDSDSDSELDEMALDVLTLSTIRAGKTWSCELTEKDDSGWTALHYAASKGNAETCRLLMKADKKRLAGSEPDTTSDDDPFGDGQSSSTPLIEMKEDIFGWTPLFLAVIELRVDAVDALLEGGSDAMAKDDLGDRPLECVTKAKAGRKRDEIRRMLKDAMDDPDLSSDSESEDDEEERDDESEDSDEEKSDR